LPLDEAMGGGSLLAHRLNGAPLTTEHGAPLRLIAPGRTCSWSVKWVDRLEVLAEEAPTTGEAIARARLENEVR
ncbi:MAG: molybdopterin-dependent oxidoreductase, partial [Chloroflexi bacterium]|nr:molybdopterin-dependent oxidoreductase [Chloroflexota bacterium]